MRTRTAVLVLIAGALGVLAVSSYATADSGKTNLDARTMIGYLEVPAISTGATGSFEARIEGNELHYRLSYSDLEAAVTQAHIHFGQRSVNGGISIWLCGAGATPGPAGTPTCPSSGTVTRTVGPGDVVGPAGQGIAAGQFDEIVAAMQAGGAYANVHSSLFPGGEIRSQINDDNQRDD
jgi:hypothetical protein